MIAWSWVVAIWGIGILHGWQARGILADREEERLWWSRQPRDDALEDGIDREGDGHGFA